MRTQIIGAVILIQVAVATAWGSSITITPARQSFLQPGSTAGWSFTLHPDSNDYLVIDGVSLTESNTIGVYTDFLELYTPFAPNTADRSFAFDSSTNSGVGMYVIDAGTPLGSLDSIQFAITYELDPCDFSLTSCSPDQTGLTLLDVSGNAPQVSLQVTDVVSSALPEPKYGWNCLLVVLASLAWQRRTLRDPDSPVSFRLDGRLKCRR